MVNVWAGHTNRRKPSSFYIQNATLAVMLGIAIVSLLVWGIDWLLEEFFTDRRYSLLWLLQVDGKLTKLIYKPWSVVSYLFVHKDLIHLLVNLVSLYFFGLSFEKSYGRRHLLGLFLFGGALAALFYPLAMELARWLGFPMLRLPLLGCSGAVLALLVAEAFANPNRKVSFLGVAIANKYFALLLVLVVLFLSDTKNIGGLFAHLGGALGGVLYALALKRIETRRDEIRFSKKSIQLETLKEKVRTSGYNALSSEERKMLKES